MGQNHIASCPAQGVHSTRNGQLNMFTLRPPSPNAYRSPDGHPIAHGSEEISLKKEYPHEKRRWNVIRMTTPYDTQRFHLIHLRKPPR